MRESAFDFKVRRMQAVDSPIALYIKIIHFCFQFPGKIGMKPFVEIPN